MQSASLLCAAWPCAPCVLDAWYFGPRTQFRCRSQCHAAKCHHHREALTASLPAAALPFQGANTSITEATTNNIVFGYAMFYGGLAQLLAGMW